MVFFDGAIPFRMGTIADMASAVIRKRGEPMKVADITRAADS